MNGFTLLNVCFLTAITLGLSAADSISLDFPNEEKYKYSIDGVDAKDGKIMVTVDQQYDLTFKWSSIKIPLYFTKTAIPLTVLKQDMDEKSGIFTFESDWSETSALDLHAWHGGTRNKITQQVITSAKESFLQGNPDIKSGLNITVTNLEVKSLHIASDWKARMVVGGNILLMPKSTVKPTNLIKDGELFTFAVPENLQKTLTIDGFDSLAQPIEVESGKVYTLRSGRESYKAFLVPKARKIDVFYAGPENKSTGSSDWEKPGLGGLRETMNSMQAAATNDVVSSFADTIVIKDISGNGGGGTKSSSSMKDVKRECVFFSDDGTFKMYISGIVLKPANK